jgi:hypothetical protein
MRPEIAKPHRPSSSQSVDIDEQRTFDTPREASASKESYTTRLDRAIGSSNIVRVQVNQRTSMAYADFRVAEREFLQNLTS